MQQQVVAEQVAVQRIEREEQVKVQEAEIQRRERELTATVLKAAEADERRIEMLAEAERQRRALEAQRRGRGDPLPGYWPRRRSSAPRARPRPTRCT